MVKAVEFFECINQMIRFVCPFGRSVPTHRKKHSLSAAAACGFCGFGLVYLGFYFRRLDIKLTQQPGKPQFLEKTGQLFPVWLRDSKRLFIKYYRRITVNRHQFLTEESKLFIVAEVIAPLPLDFVGMLI